MVHAAYVSRLYIVRRFNSSNPKGIDGGPSKVFGGLWGPLSNPLLWTFARQRRRRSLIERVMLWAALARRRRRRSLIERVMLWAAFARQRRRRSLIERVMLWAARGNRYDTRGKRARQDTARRTLAPSRRPAAKGASSTPRLQP